MDKWKKDHKNNEPNNKISEGKRAQVRERKLEYDIWILKYWYWYTNTQGHT